MNNVRNLIVLACVLTLFTGCQVIVALDAMYEKDVESKQYVSGDKSVIFVPLVHYGEKVFFESLKDSILNWKSEGYTVFYEIIRSGDLDRETNALYRLKWRKITGGGGENTREDYEASLSQVFESKIVQPEYDQLGIDSSDINADISFGELIEKYEDVYGEVVLDSCDLATPIDSNYTCGKRLKNDLDLIILDYRNEMLAERIINSRLNKIVVVYGKRHLKGVKKLLKEKQGLKEVKM